MTNNTETSTSATFPSMFTRTRDQEAEKQALREQKIIEKHEKHYQKDKKKYEKHQAKHERKAKQHDAFMHALENMAKSFEAMMQTSSSSSSSSESDEEDESKEEIQKSILSNKHSVRFTDGCDNKINFSIMKN